MPKNPYHRVMKHITLRNNYFFPTFGMNARTENETGEALMSWLQRQLLHGKESRERTRFVNTYLPRVQQLGKDRDEIITSYQKKDAKGEGLYLDKEGKETTNKQLAVSVALTDGLKATQEIEDLMNEEFIIDITPSSQENIYTIRDILLNSREDYTGIMAQKYFDWCESFQNIIDEDRNAKKKK